MQVRRFSPLLLVTGAICALTACPSSNDSTTPTAPNSAPRASFLFGGNAGVTYDKNGASLTLWAMTVTPTSTGYTLSRNNASPGGIGLGANGSIAPDGTVFMTLDDSLAGAYAKANLSDLFNNKSGFGCTSSVSTSQDTKIAVFDRLLISTATDTTHYLTMDRSGTNNTVAVHHMLFYALGPGKAFGTASCSFSGAGGTGKEVYTYTTSITVKPGWNLYADSATSSTNSIESIASNDTSYKGPYMYH